jgi:predicted amidohydrolase
VTIVRIGCAQLTPRVGDLEWNRYSAKTGIRNLAVGCESQIVVLPELMSSGSVFDSVEEARACSEPADGADGLSVG